MQAQVSGPTFTFNSVNFTAPAAGSFRVGLFNERDPRLGGEVGSDVNRDGNPAGSSGMFAVLWNTTSNNVYVDTNQNRAFADELAMTDYKVRYDVGYFGTDNPALRSASGCRSSSRPTARPSSSTSASCPAQHGSHVAGIVAANEMFGGEMSGEAPGAKFVSVRACLFIAGCTAHALLEGHDLRRQAGQRRRDQHVDRRVAALNDGNNSRCAVYNRLIEQSNVQMFISAGNNGAGLNTVGDPSVCGKVVSVGAYITRGDVESNYGSTGPAAENLHPFSSRGPTEAGGFKPTVVAPGCRGVDHAHVAAGRTGGRHVRAATGLLDAQRHVDGVAASSWRGGVAHQRGASRPACRSSPTQLRQALRSSARFVPGYGAYEQGNGLINVGAAWELLETNNVKTVDITSSVEVHTADQPVPRDAERRCRGSTTARAWSSGRPTPAVHVHSDVRRWVARRPTTCRGSATTARSPRPGQRLAAEERADHARRARCTRRRSGVHSAILNLDDPSTAGIDYQTLNTVVVAEQFTAENNYSVDEDRHGRAAMRSLHYFVYVPPGTPAFKVDLERSRPRAGNRPSRASCASIRSASTSIPTRASTATRRQSSAAAQVARSAARRRSRRPGVWEVTVEARRTSDAADAPFTLTMSILGATVSPNPDVIASATIGTPIARSRTRLTNLFGAFTGREASARRSAARESRRRRSPTSSSSSIRST